jgi:hypothetical protein
MTVFDIGKMGWNELMDIMFQLEDLSANLIYLRPRSSQMRLSHLEHGRSYLVSGHFKGSLLTGC